MKRTDGLGVVDNSSIERQNKNWTVGPPASLTARVSPPRSRRLTKKVANHESCEADWVQGTATELASGSKEAKEVVHGASPTTAAVEAGELGIEDPVSFFSGKLLRAARLEVVGIPRIPHVDWLDVYHRNLHPHGRHFVIHQHDHPVAGTHYDLRLQCNATSSISWACMYGLPGDPNSRRLNRNATETRVHNLWNHLIETASHLTGTMLIWDTGAYSVLPYRDTSTNSDVGSDGDECGSSTLTDSERLHQAFQQRKIRLQLHGTRLPPGYTLNIRADRDYFPTEQPKMPARKRRRQDPKGAMRRLRESSSTEASDIDEPHVHRKYVESLHRTASPPGNSETDKDAHDTSDEGSEVIRLTNAYTGATNDIGSVHQRKWYLSMDRNSSGFVPVREKTTGAKTWTRKRDPDGTLRGFEKFLVLGRDVERSVVTGRLAKDIMKDEGVEVYVPRGQWRSVTE